MSFINGIGGAFIFSNEPTQLAEWYAEHLGFEFEGSEKFGAYYQVFWNLDPEDPSQRRDTSFSIIRATVPLSNDLPAEEPDSMYGDQPFMVNLRTDDLDALVAHLKRKGVTMLDRQNESYGKFAWVRDGDGNRVELYEPTHDG